MRQIIKTKHIALSFIFLFTFCLSKGQVDSIVYNYKDSITIPTSSGYNLSARIMYKKSITEPLPVILFYTTYFQGEKDIYFAKISADRDYVGIVVYARGIRTNITNYSPYKHEQKDIYDVIDWISKQEWCNGEVGMFGGSYTGFSQWSAAKKLHPALKTIVPQVAVMPGYDFPMQNNVQLGFELGWAHSQILKKQAIDPSLYWTWFEKGYAYSRLDSAIGYTNKFFQEWLNHPAYDTYWSTLVPTPEEYANIDIPVLTTTGYFDGSQISAIRYFKLHNKYNRSNQHYLVIGPYDHWGGQANAASNLRGYEIDSVANLSMRNLALDWMDWQLKVEKKPEILKDKVNYQVMGMNQWQHKSSLCSIASDTLRLFLVNNKLSKNIGSQETFIKQVIDLSDREKINNYFQPTLIIDTLDASNGIIYKSQTFNEDFIISGAFTGKLKIETNKKDFDLSISFYEKMPSGKYFFLSRYVGRASYANDNTKRQLLKPYKQEFIPLNASHIISKKISRGSQLVVILNTNKHPFEIINYGSGKNPT
ncbi:MAG: CocE/NonD family hydrolase, partial [Fulvivirga sp.]|uniref:CocE/NonD family hydrolase n=1 Tax=Fulvivirga sp. TaxID=1931237 RepID=UPI0032EB5EC0